MAIKNILKLKFVTNCGLQIMQQIFKLKKYLKNYWEKTKKYCSSYRHVCIEQCLKNYWEKTKKRCSSYRHVCIFSFAIVSLMIVAVVVFYIDIKRITLVNFISGVIAVIGLVLFFMRVNIQIKQRVDERFTTAVSLLGSSETSARTGAIYSLFYLASDEKKYRKEIAQILCSHIRSKTEEKNYQETYKKKPTNEMQATINKKPTNEMQATINKKPTNEIQTTINLLFRTNGLYHKFNKELEPANLRLMLF